MSFVPFKASTGQRYRRASSEQRYSFRQANGRKVGPTPYVVPAEPDPVFTAPTLQQLISEPVPRPPVFRRPASAVSKARVEKPLLPKPQRALGLLCSPRLIVTAVAAGSGSGAHSVATEGTPAAHSSEAVQLETRAHAHGSRSAVRTLRNAAAAPNPLDLPMLWPRAAESDRLAGPPTLATTAGGGGSSDVGSISRASARPSSPSIRPIGLPIEPLEPRVSRVSGSFRRSGAQRSRAASPSASATAPSTAASLQAAQLTNGDCGATDMDRGVNGDGVLGSAASHGLWHLEPAAFHAGSSVEGVPLGRGYSTIGSGTDVGGFRAAGLFDGTLTATTAIISSKATVTESHRTMQSEPAHPSERPAPPFQSTPTASQMRTGSPSSYTNQAGAGLAGRKAHPAIADPLKDAWWLLLGPGTVTAPFRIKPC